MFERIDLTMLTPSMDLDERRAIPDSSKINDPIYNKQRAINENHDILMAGDRYIVGEKGPLKIFSPEYVGGHLNEELSHIAGENFATSATRTDITLRGERLQKALEITRRAGI